MSDRRKILIAVVLSLVVHLLLMGTFAVFTWARPKPEPPKVVVKPKPLEIEIAPFPAPTPPPVLAQATPTPTPTPASKAPVEREVIDSNGLKQAPKENQQSVFESDQNLAAGSTLPATGNVPLPSQKGKERPFPQFKNQRNTPGDTSGAPSAARPDQPAPPPLSAESKPTPRPTPPLRATPTPGPSLTPPPADDQLFALGRPTPLPTPSPSRVPRTLEQLRRELAMLRPSAPTMPPPQRPGYQPESEQTAIEGGITNRGPAGVNAIATTRGRFEKAISDAIGSRWYYYVNQRIDLLTVGDATLRIKILRSGRVAEVRIVRNSSNETFAGVCVQAAREANFPPVPDELIPMIQDGSFTIDYTFTIYPQ